MAPADKPVTIVGRINGWDISSVQAEEVKLSLVPSKDLEATGRLWTKKDIEAYQQALKDLKIEKACKEIWGTRIEDCGSLTFNVNSANPQDIQWFKAK